MYTPPVAPSLTGTMVITLADNSTTTVSIQNGKGISSIAKTSTAGLVDTYTITYNDSTTSTFSVTNGAKGDTGDSWYVWIRYAGSMPTSDADMGTTPDDWIGIYSGTEDDPSDLHYTDFDWFEYKGEKGDTGTASTITTQTIGYQASNSGTVVPSGSWATTIPVVPPGNFLWTRTQLAFNDGSVVTAYSVSRFGIDGTGAVSTVNSISPDGSGNVALTADDIPLTNNISVEDTIDQIETDMGDVSDLTTSATNCVDAINEVKTSVTNAVLQPSSAFPIPSTSVTKTMSGITASHVLVAWNFSSSAENSPPCDLTWSTASGSFTITKTSGTTSESIQPVFALPTAVAVS